MAKLRIFMIIAVLFISAVPAHAVIGRDDPPCDRTNYVHVYEGDEKGVYNLNPYYFYYFFFVTIYSGFGLEKNIGQSEILEVAKFIYEALNRKEQLVFRVCNYEKGQELDFIMKTMTIDTDSGGKRKIMIVTGNFLADGSGKYIGRYETDDRQWGTIYDIIGNRLIYYKYSIEDKLRPKDRNPNNWADYYIQDADPLNDSKALPLLSSAIKDPEYKNKGFAYLTLCEYYLSKGQTEKAKKAYLYARKFKYNDETKESFEEGLKVMRLIIACMIGRPENK